MFHPSYSIAHLHASKRIAILLADPLLLLRLSRSRADPPVIDPSLNPGCKTEILKKMNLRKREAFHYTPRPLSSLPRCLRYRWVFGNKPTSHLEKVHL